MAESMEEKIEKTLLISIQLGMIDIIDSINSGNKEYKMVIGGGRGIEYYISGLLQNKLTDAGIYDKSFDYDIYVYPMSEPSAENFYFYHPSYLGYNGYTYNKDSGYYEKPGMPHENPFVWSPYRRLLEIIREYYSDANKQGMYYRDDILSSLKFINRNTNYINIDEFEKMLKNGRAFIPQMLYVETTVVWRVKIRVPLQNGNYQEIELIDLKNSLRLVERNDSNEIILFNEHGHPDPHGKYVKSRDRTHHLHSRGGYWNYNNKGDFTSTCILAHPAIGGKYGKNIYIPRPSILLRDNSLLIGNKNDGRYILQGGYDTLFNIVARVLGISENDKTRIDFPFIMDEQYKRLARDNPKYTSKYKKRFVRVFCLAYMFNHLYEPQEKIFPRWNIQSMSLDKSLTFYNNQIISYSGSRFILDTNNKPYLFINGNMYPYAYSIFNNGYIPAYMSKPSLIDIGAKIINPSSQSSINANSWEPIKNIHLIRTINLARRRSQLGNLTYQEGSRNISYNEVSRKWSHSAGATTNFPLIFSKSFDVTLDILIRVSAMDKRNFRSNFMKAISTASSRPDIFLYIRSCLFFSYRYPPNSFDNKEFLCYRWGLPMSVLIENSDTRINSLSWNKIENLRKDTVIYNTRFLSTTMNTYLNLDSPILYLQTVREVISKKHTLYIFKLKNKGFLYMDDMSMYPAEHEILIPSFSKFKIISREWKIIPIFESFDQVEKLNNYRQIYCITLEQIEDDYDVFFSGSVTPAALPVLATSLTPGQPPFSQILQGGGAGTVDTVDTDNWHILPQSPFILNLPTRVTLFSPINYYFSMIQQNLFPTEYVVPFDALLEILITDLANINTAPGFQQKKLTVPNQESITNLLGTLRTLYDIYTKSQIIFKENKVIATLHLSEEHINTYNANIGKLQAFKPIIEHIKTIYHEQINKVDYIIEKYSVNYDSQIKCNVYNTYKIIPSKLVEAIHSFQELSGEYQSQQMHSHAIASDFYFCMDEVIMKINSFIVDQIDIDTIVTDIMIQKQSDLAMLEDSVVEFNKNYSDIIAMMRDVEVDEEYYTELTRSRGLVVGNIATLTKVVWRLIGGFSVYKNDIRHVIIMLVGEGLIVLGENTGLGVISPNKLENTIIHQFLLFIFLWLRKRYVSLSTYSNITGLNEGIKESIQNTFKKYPLKLQDAPINSELSRARGKLGNLTYGIGTLKRKVESQAQFEVTGVGLGILGIGMSLCYLFMLMLF